MSAFGFVFREFPAEHFLAPPTRPQLGSPLLLFFDNRAPQGHITSGHRLVAFSVSTFGFTLVGVRCPRVSLDSSAVPLWTRTRACTLLSSLDPAWAPGLYSRVPPVPCYPPFLATFEIVSCSSLSPPFQLNIPLFFPFVLCFPPLSCCLGRPIRYFVPFYPSTASHVVY